MFPTLTASVKMASEESADQPAPLLRPHVHTAVCNHTSAADGEVLAAVRRRDAAAVRDLLESGSSTEERDEVGRTSDKPSAVPHPSQIHAQDKWTPLIWAASEGMLDVARELINAGANVDSSDFEVRGLGADSWSDLCPLQARGTCDAMPELSLSQWRVLTSDSWGTVYSRLSR